MDSASIKLSNTKEATDSKGGLRRRSNEIDATLWKIWKKSNKRWTKSWASSISKSKSTNTSQKTPTICTTLTKSSRSSPSSQPNWMSCRKTTWTKMWAGCPKQTTTTYPGQSSKAPLTGMNSSDKPASTSRRTTRPSTTRSVSTSSIVLISSMMFISTRTPFCTSRADSAASKRMSIDPPLLITNSTRIILSSFSAATATNIPPYLSTPHLQPKMIHTNYKKSSRQPKMTHTNYKKSSKPTKPLQ